MFPDETLHTVSYPVSVITLFLADKKLIFSQKFCIFCFLVIKSCLKRPQGNGTSEREPLGSPSEWAPADK